MITLLDDLISDASDHRWSGALRLRSTAPRALPVDDLAGQARSRA